jgi:hypothetical protein
MVSRTGLIDSIFAALMMLYFGGLFVVALAGIGWFVFTLVTSDPIGIAVTIAGTFVMAVIAGLVLGGINRIQRKRSAR